MAIIPQSTPLPQLASLEEYPEAEVREICEHAEPFFADVFRFPALTGLRQAELTWLTREDPDAEHRLVRIRAKVFPEEGLRWDPKGDDRVVPLSAPALAIAKEMLARSGGCWLFAAPAGPGVVDDRLRASRLWAQREKAKKATGGPGDAARLQTLLREHHGQRQRVAVQGDEDRREEERKVVDFQSTAAAWRRLAGV